MFSEAFLLLRSAGMLGLYHFGLGVGIAKHVMAASFEEARAQRHTSVPETHKIIK